MTSIGKPVDDRDAPMTTQDNLMSECTAKLLAAVEHYRQNDDQTDLVELRAAVPQIVNAVSLLQSQSATISRLTEENADAISSLDYSNRRREELSVQCTTLESSRALDQSRIAAMEAALKRLGSMEAFDVSRGIYRLQDAELLMRIEFASAALKSQQEGRKA